MMARVIITIPEDLLRSVDAWARRAGRSRSAMVRSAISEWVAVQERAGFEELLAAGYQEMAASMGEAAADYSLGQADASDPGWRW